jgi:hypothetical protein
MKEIRNSLEIFITPPLSQESSGAKNGTGIVRPMNIHVTIRAKAPGYVGGGFFSTDAERVKIDVAFTAQPDLWPF